jgi:hypothetical protein
MQIPLYSKSGLYPARLKAFIGSSRYLYLKLLIIEFYLLSL